MSAEIFYLHGRPAPIGQFIRVGHSGHRQLETLYSAGRFLAQRVVIDAAQFDAQHDLISALWEAGTEIVLDTNVAELSSVGRFEGAARNLAWANKSRPLAPSDFQGVRKREIVKLIADFAVNRSVDTVLAPTHLVSGFRDEWVGVDARCPDLLRVALDQAGGKDISIDYPLLIPYSMLRDSAQRRALINELADLPYDNLWMRVSGFGADASAVGIRRYISVINDFHALHKPLVADCIGGLASLGVAAFGAVTAVSHGVGEKERFDTGSWNSRPKKGGGGQSGRLYLPGLDRQFKLKDAEEIMKARGGRRLLACHDHDCCPLGLEDMLRNPKGHFLTQRRKQLLDLENTPEQRRIERFLDHHLASADRTARQVAKLKIDNQSITDALQKVSVRLDRMRGVLEDLGQTVGSEATRAAPMGVRSSVHNRKKEHRS